MKKNKKRSVANKTGNLLVIGLGLYLLKSLGDKLTK